MLFTKCRNIVLLLVTLWMMFFVASFFVAEEISETRKASDPRPFAGSVKTQKDIEAMFQEDIAHVLLNGEKNLKEWADELENTPPKTPNDVWITYLVCLRAERDETVLKMIPLLFNIVDTVPSEVQNRSQMGSNVLRPLYHSLITPLRPFQPERWHVMVTFSETFDTILAYFDPHSFKQAGWSDDEYIAWVEKRLENACEQKPDELRPESRWLNVSSTLTQAAMQWQQYYLWQLHLKGREQQELERLNNEAKEEPLSTRKLDLLIHAATQSWTWNGLQDSFPVILPDLDWLIPTAENRSVFEAWNTAGQLARMDDRYTRKIRIAFLERILADPLMPENTTLHLQAMDVLNQLYLDDNRPDDAQKIMLEARELRKEFRLPTPPDANLRAGMTQAASGQRVVETEIREREVIDESNPGNWRERFDYYMGREEYQEAETAYRRMLELFDNMGHRDNCWELFVCLARQERYEDIIALFRERRVLLQNEPSKLWELYFMNHRVLYRESTSTVCRNAYEKLLVEDMKTALDKIRAIPKSSWPQIMTHWPQASDIYESHRQLTRIEPVLLVRERMLDFENDPFAWDFLILGVEGSNDLRTLIAAMLFPQGDRSELMDEAAFQLFVKAMKDEKMTPRLLLVVGEAMIAHTSGRRPKYHKQALPFFEEALKRNEDPRFRSSICRYMATCLLELGEWKNVEAYSIESYLGGSNAVENLVWNLRRAADLAEKAGETKEAERIRQRIANLGN